MKNKRENNEEREKTNNRKGGERENELESIEETHARNKNEGQDAFEVKNGRRRRREG